MTEDTTIGVDLAKNVFEVAISHTPGTIAMRRRLKRARFGAFFAEQKPAIVVMEACGSAHYCASTASSSLLEHGRSV